MCLYPKLVKNPKYRVNKKNKGNVPHMQDKRVGYVPIGCGYCFECMKQKANNWRIRMIEEVKVNTNGKFVTLTLSSETYRDLMKKVNAKDGYSLDNAIATYAVRKFLERWRKKHGKSVRHWLVTELGGRGTENIHLHGIIWTDDVKEIDRIWNSEKCKYGYTWLGKMSKGRLINYVSERTVNYIVKYVTKTDQKHKCYKPVVLCSPGIGASYTKTKRFEKNKYKATDTDTTYRLNNGGKMNLPIYYRNKAYTEEEREALWLQRLDKQERYIGGEKVHAEDEEQIQGLLAYYQRINAEMGYGSPNTWKATQYENERRKLKQEERLQKLKEKEEKEQIRILKINKRMEDDLIIF